MQTNNLILNEMSEVVHKLGNVAPALLWQSLFYVNCTVLSPPPPPQPPSLLSPFPSFLSYFCLSPEAVFQEKDGVWDPMPKLTITHLACLIVNSVRSQPSAQYKGKEWSGEELFNRVEHIYVCRLISKTTNSKGGGKG